MTHLRIEQNTTGIEEVSSAVIKKLYDLVYSGTLDNTSNLQGRLHTTSTYQSYVDYLTGQYPNLYITANKYYMNFADPVVEQICATTFGDGVGCTRSDLANVLNNQLSSSVFGGNTDITSFDEFQYFTNITTIPQNCFLSCTDLSSITFPSGLTTIGNAAFQNCTSLTSVQLPNTVEYLLGDENNGAFKSCTSLTSVSGLENIRRFNGRVFSGCTNLGVNQDLVLNIREHLANNINLYYTFSQTGYKSVTLHSTIPLNECSGTFQSMPNLKVLDFSDTVNTKIFEPGYYSNVETIILPATITQTINWRFRADTHYLSKIIILATTPPPLESTTYWYVNGRGANPYFSPCYIYVPDEALNDYQTANVWSGIADRIRPLSHSDLDNVTWYTKEHPQT